ncbi:hypothetical protein QP933_10445 [Corynebacterium pseudodiphtheriticum]|uniref:hypothetical protein n=1 Tax=Corynebacterium TaxID=1716 RepID=UPI00164CE15A|nr:MULTISPECIES: hypothetical protein [Corynebacterium]MDK8501337.1 hypothetical protein [Corynebacterium pseudodiphtheriticum]MDK8584342.1 hypothetical protein [Corynebacterium pseudodiphtheriticum]MDK8840060.1 hypothetical protein [Corynebacterium pseudodiphtheriticum]WKS33526.1 hypothetical protein NLL50_07340 [Corynebacterium propinquum]WKS40024.1 hypothetical protein NLL41_07470 [Corynebacterium propinquum]
MMDPHHDTGADNLRGKSVEEQLEKILREAEASLSELRSELAEQRRRKELSLEIERLPEHLENTTVQWSVVRDFFSELIGELRETREDELGTSQAGETDSGPASGQHQDGGHEDNSDDLHSTDQHGFEHSDHDDAENNSHENPRETHGSQR